MNHYFGAKDDEGEMYDYDEGYEELEDLFDFDDEDYSALKDALDGYYDDDYYGDEYYDGDYYYDDNEDYDEDLKEQIAALENYYDSLNMNQYQRAYNAKYMNLMNAYNQLLAESNLYTNNYYNQMGMDPGAASKASTNDVANAYSEYANQYYY